jgi:prevent-host-death family protein
MKSGSVAEVKSQFSTFLEASVAGPVVVTQNGRPVAVIVGDQDEIERLMMAHSPQLQEIVERSRQQFRDGNWLPEDEFWSQFETDEASRGPVKPKPKPKSPRRRK